MDAVLCKEWLIFSMGSMVGYSDIACSRRLRRRLSALTLTCSQLYYRSARWSNEGFHKVTRLSLFLYGTGVTLPSSPISGGSRKMDGAGNSGMGSLFSPCLYLPKV